MLCHSLSLDLDATLQKTEDGQLVTFKPNVLMLGLTPSAYVLRAISSVRPSDLEQALLVGVYCSILK